MDETLASYDYLFGRTQHTFANWAPGFLRRKLSLRKFLD